MAHLQQVVEFPINCTHYFLQLARLPRERQEQIAAATSAGTGLEHSQVPSSSKNVVRYTHTDEAKGTATSTDEAEDQVSKVRYI